MFLPKEAVQSCSLAFPIRLCPLPLSFKNGFAEAPEIDSFRGLLPASSSRVKTIRMDTLRTNTSSTSS